MDLQNTKQNLSGGRMKAEVLTVFALAVALLLSACGTSDADLKKAAADKLTADKVTGVTVDVRDGVAILTGEVADETVKREAEASVESVAGIKAVTNDVKIKPPPAPVSTPIDPMLKGKLDEALRKAGCTGATVEIKDGKVTITGTVPEAKYGECFMVVSQAGATGIDNQLKKGK